MVSTKMPFNKLLGFTLIELLIVVAVIGILAAIAYPNYQDYVIKGKRADMMSEMQNIAQQIERQKLSAGKYSGVSTTQLIGDGDYPSQGTALYTVTLPDTLTSSWTIKAEPKPGTQMADDGVLTLDSKGLKCRGTGDDKVCGVNDEWR